jgi:phosphate uptake regulator
VTDDDLRPPQEPRSTTDAVILTAVEKPNQKFWLLLGTVVAALLLVVLVLPALVPDPNTKTPDAIVESPVEAIEVEALDANEEGQYRHEAEQALQMFLRSRANPDLSNAEIWAENDWHAAMAKADNGDKEFGKGRHFNALQNYQDANSLLQSILDSRSQTLQLNLQKGWQRLQANALEEANEAFELVIAMQPDHSDALLGLNRTSVRSEILALVTKARQAVITDDLLLAAEIYIKALQLDPLYELAQESLFEVEAELRKQAFQTAMGRALKAIDNEQFSTAEKALTEASGMFPGDVAISDARERLSSARRQFRLRNLRSQAEQMAAKENWHGASENYRAALAIDPQAAFARNGLDLTQKKQTLHKQLDHYLADPTRLYSDDPLANARKLLAANPQADSGEPILAGKLKNLQQYVTIAAIPVDLVIVSDNLTQVTIYKVGRLGVFEQKQLSLRPGKYTVTGSRKGYRDVHKVIELKPGMEELSVQVFAEEPI